MQKCGNCGFENPDDMFFCGKCGKALDNGTVENTDSNPSVLQTKTESGADIENAKDLAVADSNDNTTNKYKCPRRKKMFLILGIGIVLIGAIILGIYSVHTSNVKMIYESQQAMVPHLESLGKEVKNGNVDVSDEANASKDKLYFLGLYGRMSLMTTTSSGNKVGAVTWTSTDDISTKKFNDFIKRADEFFDMRHTVKSYDNISDESYVWYGYSNRHWAIAWLENKKINMRWYIYDSLVVPTVTPTPTAAPKKTTAPVDFSINSVKKTIKRENYGYVSYLDLARNPSEYKDKYITYEGEIVQTMEDYSIKGIVYYNIRLAVGGDNDSIVYITYMTGDSDPRLLEGDYVQVYGKVDGLYTYESTSGKSITLPKIIATLIE